MRILVVTHAPLASEFGAGQIAINLAQPLQKLGHEVVLWSPDGILPKTRWWQRNRIISSKFKKFLANQKKFDVIDSPASFITRKVKQSSSIVIARSVQPDILYLLTVLNHEFGSIRKILRTCSQFVGTLVSTILILQGWHRANYIACFGSLELSWMAKWFFWWRRKLILYYGALSTEDQITLAKVRENRQEIKNQHRHIRFIWIGRWTSHKGVKNLLNFIRDRSAHFPEETYTIAGCGSNAQFDCTH